jgi:hypothetical protein
VDKIWKEFVAVLLRHYRGICLDGKQRKTLVRIADDSVEIRTWHPPNITLAFHINNTG